MLTEKDEQWLREVYPDLAPTAEGVVGILKFRATYNNQTGRFLVLRDGLSDDVGGLALSGEFNVRVQKRDDKTISDLPALYVADVDSTADRHFGQKDKSGCLCSPLEEDEFLRPEFRFREFLEQLVIPFLYGQVFYSNNRQWPWQEYAHGATGLLQSYSEIANSSKAMDCVRKLAQCGDVWPRMRAALLQKPYLKGHTPCFCKSGDPIRRCHPSALQGAVQLQRDIRTLAIPIP
jgi:hypothetical protein